MAQHKLYAKMSKCNFIFFAKKIKYLGHIVSKDEIWVDPKKTKVVLNWFKPTNLKVLRDFLGLNGYHYRFIRGYEVIASPLTKLVKQRAFC